jgi:zinc transporter ZupT
MRLIANVVLFAAGVFQKMPILLIIPVFSTLAGGALAVHFRKSATLLAALGAGLLLGAAFLDLLPEAISLSAFPSHAVANVLGIALLSFLCFFAIQSAMDAAAEQWASSANAMGKVGGAMLIFHSLRDGMAIGLSYAASHSAGYAVAFGIAAHDIGDGMNTILLTTRGRRPRPVDYLFLGADCLAPFVGGLLTIYWKFSARSSVVLLAIASGFFIQMATGDFLPEVRRFRGKKLLVLPAVLTGAAIIYGANLLVGRLH